MEMELEVDHLAEQIKAGKSLTGKDGEKKGLLMYFFAIFFYILIILFIDMGKE